MAFEGLADKLGNAFKKLKSKGKLTESDVKEAMREVRLALLEADVNYKVAKDFTARITERAVGEDVMESLTPRADGHQDRQRRADGFDGRQRRAAENARAPAGCHHDVRLAGCR